MEFSSGDADIFGTVSVLYQLMEDRSDHYTRLVSIFFVTIFVNTPLTPPVFFDVKIRLECELKIFMYSINSIIELIVKNERNISSKNYGFIYFGTNAG